MDADRWSNILRLDAAYTAGRARFPGRPLEAYIEVAARCNLRCEMCPILVDPRYQPGSGRPGFLSQELFEKLAPLFPTLTRAHLFGLGEPMLHPDLAAWTARLAASGVEVWITTNATRVDDAGADRLARAGLHRITVSIDGATPATYERIRRRGRFADVRRGLEALGAARRRHGRPLLYLSMVGMAGNLAELPDLVDLCAEVGGDGVFVEDLYPYPHPQIEGFVRREDLGHLGKEAVEEIVARARLRAQLHGVDFVTRMEDLGPIAAPEHPAAETGEARLPWACSEPWTTINVDAAGEVRPCCFNDAALGSLGAAPIEEIWNGEASAALRSDHTAGRVPAGCTTCVRNGRVKRSPWLQTRLAPTVPPAPPGPPAGGLVIEAPLDGDLVAGTLVLVGRKAGGWFRRKLKRRELPDVWLDETLIAMADSLVQSGDAFAAIVPLPYVTPGSHRLSLRPPGGGPETAFLERRIQVGAPCEGLPAVSRLALPVPLGCREPPPLLRLDGHSQPLERWLCGPYGYGQFAGLALLDTAPWSPGVHDLELRFARHPPRRTRVVRLG